MGHRPRRLFYLDLQGCAYHYQLYIYIYNIYYVHRFQSCTSFSLLLVVAVHEKLSNIYIKFTLLLVPL
jgi:hypothetical protein